MRYLVTGKEMSLYDKQTSEHFHIPSVVLMEQAAHAFVEQLMKDVIGNGQLRNSAYVQTAACDVRNSSSESGTISISASHRILIVCGTGNNGGDGIAIARLLNQRGIDTEIYAPVDGHRTSELFDLQYQIYQSYGYPIRKQLNVPQSIADYDIVIDAIFGTGLSKPVTGAWADVIECMNAMPGRKIAVDIASGVSADTGEVLGTAFHADETITFSFGKLGQYLWPGAAYSGKVTVVPIGITEESFLRTVPHVRALEECDLNRLPSRKPNSHKGSYGKLLVIAGSAQMAGAAIFAAKAAYRMGTGLVKVMTPESNRVIIQTQVPEAILSTYPDMLNNSAADDENSDLKIEDSYNYNNYKIGEKWNRCKFNALHEQVRTELSWADALVIGPGIGTGEISTEILRLVLEESKIPMVLDADALNIISREGWQAKLLENLNCFRSESGETLDGRIIITPHMGEMSRLTGKSIGEIKNHICEEASRFSADHQVMCVLKDARTVTAAPDGSLFLNLSGNNGMATAGSGDVLSGILGGLLAQGLDPVDAAPLGVYFHGRAGDAARDRLGARYMMASDIVEGMSS